MKILRAQHAGFCFGVRRAAQMALDLRTQGHEPVFTLGPLMHNPQEVLRLDTLGILSRERIGDCVGGKTLIRTHGVSREEYQRAKELGIDLLDATCPHVLVPRRHMREFGRDGRTVILLGDRGHPEVQAMLSYAEGSVSVVSGPEEIPALPRETPIGLVAQTTQTREIFTQVETAVRSVFNDVRSVCTICSDTQSRQQEGIRLAAQSDKVLVVGGRSSANTCRLASICRSLQSQTYHVECAAELSAVPFAPDDVVAVLSGASTPDWIILEVDLWLRNKA